MSRPLIGIACDILPVDEGQLRERPYTWASYVDAVVRAGGAPVLIPAGSPDIENLLDSLHGVLLTGGDDISPDSYGERNAGCAEMVDSRRQSTDLALVPLARARSIPLLGICLGSQMICVSAGGSLVQDIATGVENHLNHGGRPGNRTRHDVEIEPESTLATILGARIVNVNSGHHQCVRNPGEGLRVVARTDDGVIEAIEDPSHPFLLGVQWHPEEMLDEASTERLFREFVQAVIRCRVSEKP